MLLYAKSCISITFLFYFQASGLPVTDTQVTLVGDNTLTIDELTVMNAARVTFGYHSSDPFEVTINSIRGSPVVDKQALGTLAVGAGSKVTVISAGSYIPINLDLKPGGSLTLPRQVKLLNTDNHINGTFGGVQELTVVKSNITFGSHVMSSVEMTKGYITVQNITLLSDGKINLLEDVRYMLTIFKYKACVCVCVCVFMCVCVLK